MPKKNLKTTSRSKLPQSNKVAITPNKSLRKKNIIISETTSAILSTKTLTKAAELLGISRTSFYERLDRYPGIREIIDKTRLNASLTLVNASQRASETLVSGLSDTKVKYDMAKDILDRVGVAKQTNQTNIAISSLEGLIQINVDKD